MHPDTPHVLNLRNLLWLRSECARCAEGAARRFSLDVDSVHLYRDLSEDTIDAVSRELDISLLVPRADVHRLCAQGRNSSDLGNDCELAMHNLQNLHVLHDTCLHSNGDAVWVFRISQETAQAYRSLKHEQLHAVCEVWQTSLVVPRYNAQALAKLLETPAGARGFFAAAYETEIALANEAARRSIYLTH